jgi:Putative beta barrel porin-7 (BBP7)
MRHGMPLAIACLLIGAEILSAQQRSALGPPEPSAAGAPTSLPPSPPSPLFLSTFQDVGPPHIPNLVSFASPYAAPATSQVAPALGPPPSPYSPPANTQVAPALGPPPTPYAPPPYYEMPGAYPPPPGEYTPLAYPPSRIVPRDPAGNPGAWIGAEALLWWTKNQPLSIPVITTGPASQGANAGNLGAPGTTSLNAPLHFDATGGVRLFAGVWFDVGHVIGVEGSVFYLSRQSAGFGAFDRSGNGSFVINEPLAGAPFSTQVSAPGFDTGGATVAAASRLAGGDINLLYNLYRTGGWTINLLGGYRYLELDESLRISANSTMFVTTTYSDNMGNVLVTAPPGSTITVIDRFGTRNQFNGGQLGAEFQFLRDRWSIGGAVKLAMGATHEVITIDGITNVFPVNSTPVPLTGGNFATIQTGRYARDRFALAPEAELNVGYQITPWMRAAIGYNFLYLSSVARPGHQIDNTYDGVSRPIVPMSSSSYWTQGLNFSLQFRF